MSQKAVCFLRRNALSSSSRSFFALSNARSILPHLQLPQPGQHRRPLTARASDKGIHCTWSNTSEEALFPFVWLRDACQDEASVHPTAKQKLFRTSDVPRDLEARKIQVSQEGLTVHWTRALSPSDPQVSFFEDSFLRRYASENGLSAYQRKKDLESRPWTAQNITQKLCTIPYSRHLSAQYRLEASQALHTDGIALFRSVDTADTSEEGCELVKLAEQLGSVRKTWYGTTFDVKSLKAAKNIAYTNLDLGFHQDLVHFYDPPRYQFLHFLYGHPTLKGGLSRFVDSYAVAEELKRVHPEHYQALCELPVAFEYKNDGRWRYAERPTVELNSAGEMVAINYSPPFQGPLPLHKLGESGVKALRDALQAFDAIAEDPRWVYEISLQPGDCIGFDNRRVLHARTAFSWDADDGISEQVGRHLKGLYVEGDAVRETYRVLSEEL